jgi:hypothetical protein
VVSIRGIDTVTFGGVVKGDVLEEPPLRGRRGWTSWKACCVRGMGRST